MLHITFWYFLSWNFSCQYLLSGIFFKQVIKNGWNALSLQAFFKTQCVDILPFLPLFGFCCPGCQLQDTDCTVQSIFLLGSALKPHGYLLSNDYFRQQHIQIFDIKSMFLLSDRVSCCHQRHISDSNSARILIAVICFRYQFFSYQKSEYDIRQRIFEYRKIDSGRKIFFDLGKMSRARLFIRTFVSYNV